MTDFPRSLVDWLVRDLAIATGRSEAVVRLAHGMDAPADPEATLGRQRRPQVGQAWRERQPSRDTTDTEAGQ